MENDQEPSGTVRNGQERSGTVRNGQERSGTVRDGEGLWVTLAENGNGTVMGR